MNGFSGLDWAMLIFLMFVIAIGFGGMIWVIFIKKDET